MTFIPKIAEQRFLLNYIGGDHTAGVDDETRDAILEGAGQFAAGEWAPLSRIGDVVGAKFAQDRVVMPAGYAEAYQAYVEAGWGTIGVPERFGGQGLSFALQTAVMETLGTANMAFALCPTLTLGAVEALVHHGTVEQQRRYLPHLASGEWTGTMNLTEPQAGSDVGALSTRAQPRQDGTWLIAGTKIYISFGDHDMAENIVHLVLARTPDAPSGTRGISLFLVPKFRLDDAGRPGASNDVRTVSIEHKMGLHASPTCILSFGEDGDCVGELVGPVGGGMAAMFTMMNNARLTVGLQGVQIAEAATQKALAHARERVQSARAGASDRAPVRIVEHPDVRRMLLRMKAQTQAARALVYYAAAMVDRAADGEDAARLRLELLTPLAKAHATDLGCEVASIGIQVHGGMGYVEETGAARFLRDARITPIYEGTNGIQAADLVGRKLGLDGGHVFERLIQEMRSEASDTGLRNLIDACEGVGARLRTATSDDRLAASYPFLTMLSTAVCGWLLERQTAATGDDAFGRDKRNTVRFYVEQILPEAFGLEAAATATAEVLYEIDADALTT